MASLDRQLYDASAAGRHHDALLLIDRGAEVDDAFLPNFWTPLIAASANGHTAAVTLLIDRGAEIDRGDEEGFTAFYHACQYGHIEAATLLLDRGADVDRAGDDDCTPLIVACAVGEAGAARLCLDRGADVNREMIGGWTALLISCYAGRIDAACLCLERGADINRALSSELPHDVARKQGHETMAAWLKRIHAAGSWARYVSEPRYKLVVLRELSAKGLARRRRADSGEEHLLDFLFPPDQRRNKRARRHQLHLPDELFSIVARYYWGGGMSAEEKAAATAEELEADGRAAAEPSESEASE